MISYRLLNIFIGDGV